ncbi:MAG: TonB-dependent receptor [Crocinitomicaceae bacterium]
MICGLLLVPLVSFSQTIKGSVKDQNNEALYGVKVSIPGTYLGTYSDPEGAYQLKNVPDGNVTLSFELDGYETVTKEVKVAGNAIALDITMDNTVQHLHEISVIHVKANEKTPTTYKDLDKEAIEKRNFGQDLPMLLRFTPSTVSTSDAGAGVGYTGIRIRGVDPTRTNVTINGIPLNDSESHGVFWVNMPDFASSAQSIQVQRGVGTSANGAAAFGASININTNKLQTKAYGEIDNGYGSFNTWRHTVKAGTGLINNKFSMNARLSKISSEGYIDRASSDLKSFYLDGTWQGKKSSLTANIFSGMERTYQSWYGTPQSVVEGNEADIIAYADRNYIFGDDRENLLNSGRTYNFYTYENEVDNYQQDHYQLHFRHRFNSRLKLNVKGHYTRGRGYFEQFRNDDDLSDYGLEPVVFTNDTVTSGDFIRRRWLDNHFYGGIFSLNYHKGKFDLTAGGGANQYIGGHFGEVIWAEYASNSELGTEYYNNDGNKFEAQSYAKATYRHSRTTYYADLQFRHIAYEFLGVDEVNGSLQEVTQDATYNFINPKAGLMIDFNSSNNAYLSVAMANREPVRSDFRENTPENRPQSEQLINLETGYRYKSRKFIANANFYYMLYTNQLVLTGQINDVGGYTRTNVENSYRSGIELDAGYSLLRNLSIAGNLTLSQNKISEFIEYVDNYDVGGQDEIVHTNTDLAFSPNIISALGIDYQPVEGLEIGFTTKYVGQQFLDNTSSEDRKIDAYNFSNLRLSYTLKDVVFKEMTIGVQVNNVFDQLFENNGYTFGYVAGGTRTIENFYYPQAGRNFMTRLTIKL